MTVAMMDQIHGIDYHDGDNPIFDWFRVWALDCSVRSMDGACEHLGYETACLYHDDRGWHEPMVKLASNHHIKNRSWVVVVMSY